MKPLQILSFLTLAGCASHKLSIDLDLYSDKHLSEKVGLSKEQLDKIYDALRGIEKEAGELRNDRIALAQDLLATYKQVFGAIARAKGQEVKENLYAGFDAQLADYVKAVGGKYHEVTVLHLAVQENLKVYVSTVCEDKECNDSSESVCDAKIIQAKARVLDSLRKLEDAFVELGGSLKTDYEQSMRWEIVVAMLKDENLAKVLKATGDVGNFKTSEIQGLKESVAQLAKRIRKLRDSGHKIPLKLVETFESIAAGDVANLDKKAGEAEKAAKDASLSIGPGLEGAVALENLVKYNTLLTSQLDRLQDAADPVWRIVSDPRNSWKWKGTFTKTFFYAEGNSSVVVVRDSPMSFRIQRGQNNPTALIQGQMQITRALANAAISIAGAAAGVPIKLPAGAKGLAAEPKPEQPASPDPDKFAAGEAKLRKESQMRTVEARTLRQELTKYRDAIKALDEGKPEDQKKLQELGAQIKSLLEAHKKVLSDTTPSK